MGNLDGVGVGMKKELLKCSKTCEHVSSLCFEPRNGMKSTSTAQNKLTTCYGLASSLSAASSLRFVLAEQEPHTCLKSTVESALHQHRARDRNYSTYYVQPQDPPRHLRAFPCGPFPR